MPFLKNAQFNALPSFTKPNDQDMFPFCLTHCSDGFSKHKALFWLGSKIVLQLNTAAAALCTVTKHTLASDTRDTCVLFVSMFYSPLVECKR